MQGRIRSLPKAIAPRWESPDPPGVVGTYGDDAIEWAARELGIVPGPWQAYAIRKALRFDKLGDLIHRIVLLSTARQNGKSVVVRIIFGWLLDEGRLLPPFRGWTTLLAAAHDAGQARIMYANVLADLLSIDRLKAETKGRYAEVRLTEYRGVVVHGLKLDTVTHIPGSARGLSAGGIAWDEMLTQTDWSMWEALGPTQSAQRSPIMVLTSTAGYDDSIVLRAFYDRLVRQATGAAKPDATFYGAWWQSESPDAGLDWRELRRANPALGDGRLTRQAIISEHELLPAPSFQRERLNHWVESKADSAIAPALWAACKLPAPLDGVDPPYVLGVDIQPGWGRATITAAAARPDGRIGVEVYRELVTDVTADRLIELIDAFPRPVAAVVYAAVSGAAAQFDRHKGETWGIDWLSLKPHEVVRACMDVQELIQSRRLAVDDPLIDSQVPDVVKRPVGSEGAFVFSRQASPGAIDGFLALTFAAHIAASSAKPPSIL